jgi:hypothetical protein
VGLGGIILVESRVEQEQVAMRLAVFLLCVSAFQLVGCAGNLPARTTRLEASTTVREISAPAPDAEGRQLENAPHVMDIAMMEELRQRVERYKGLNDQAIMRSMRTMGPNYTWYVSDRSLRGEVGVLILTHGFQEHGDRLMSTRVRAIAESRPTALAMGMSMMTSDHVQLALNNLAAAGAKDIIVVPAISTRFNSMMRQWNFIFDLQDEPQYGSVPRVAPPARLHIVSPLEDHELVGETLVQYAAEISSDPRREEVIIVAHGPVAPDDNRTQLAMLGRLASYIDARTEYAAISAFTLQDDAALEVRVANVRALRDKVRAAGEAGHDVLIITNLLGTRTVQGSLRRDLKGLNYKFNAKGLIQHENFIRWIEQSVAAAAADIE